MALDLASLAVVPSHQRTAAPTGGLPARGTGAADMAALVFWGMVWRFVLLTGGAALLTGAVPEFPVGRARAVLGGAVLVAGLLRPWRRRALWASIWRTQAAAVAVWLMGSVPLLFGPVLLAALAVCVVEPPALRLRRSDIPTRMPRDEPRGRPAPVAHYDAFAAQLGRVPRHEPTVTPTMPILVGATPPRLFDRASPATPPVLCGGLAGAQRSDAPSYDGWSMPGVPAADAEKLRDRIVAQATAQDADVASALRSLGFRPTANGRGVLALSDGRRMQAPAGSYQDAAGAVVTPRRDRRRLDPVEAARRERLDEQRLVLQMRRAKTIGPWTARRMLRSVARGASAADALPVTTGWL